MSKEALRREICHRLKTLPKAARGIAACHLARLIQTEPAWRSADRIFAFIPLPSEPDCRQAFLPHHQILVPLSTKPGGSMIFQKIRSAQEDSKISPPHGLSHWPPWQFDHCPHPKPLPSTQPHPTPGDIVLVPGLAFSPQGARLGRGGGYYDRFLASCPPGVHTWGLAFACQILESLPQEPHDQRVHRVAVADDNAAWWLPAQ